jgi:phosphatidylinositol glycan class T
MRLYLHTVEVEVQTSSLANLTKDDIIRDVAYRSAIDRHRPSQLELEVTLPPNTSVSLSYDFDKSLLYIEEYPPDANHGFEIAPAILAILGDTNSYVSRTAPLLLSLPTPDFSMPYNVIILTCTVMALAFGTIYNMLSKRILPETEAEILSRQILLNRILKSLGTFIKGEAEVTEHRPVALEKANTST